jgi:hypothetical protein
MDLDATLLTTFRARFEAKEPDPKNFVRRVTKLDVYLTVEDLVEARRSKGFAWEGIAEDFSALGVDMPVATLKTCFRRARNIKRSGASARPKTPRRSTRPLRVERQAERSAGGSVAEILPISEGASSALVDAAPPTTPAATEVPSSNHEEASNVAADAHAQNPQAPADAASGSADRVASNTPPMAATDADAHTTLESGPGPCSDAAAVDSPSPTLEGSSQSFPVAQSGANGGSREEMVRDGGNDSAPTEELRSLAADGHSAAGTRNVALRTVEGEDEPPRAALVDHAARNDAAKNETVTPPAVAPNPRDVSRLSELRARASPPDKRRMAFIPRPDEEL